jgi:hypothetical protein
MAAILSIRLLAENSGREAQERRQRLIVSQGILTIYAQHCRT